MREERNYTRWEAPEALKEVDCKEFGGERAFCTGGLELRRCVFHEGESALKCCRDIVADGCRFEGKYPFWHVDGFRITDCVFTPGARAALWYSRNLVMKDTRVDAPKMFREMENLYLENVTVPDAQETLWSCRGVTLRDVEVKGADYLFAHSADIDIDGYRQEGNYSFQYCRDVVIRNAVIHSRMRSGRRTTSQYMTLKSTESISDGIRATCAWCAAASTAPSRCATARTW